MSKSKTIPATSPDEALRLLEESLSYFTPVPIRHVSLVEYEDLPLTS